MGSTIRASVSKRPKRPASQGNLLQLIPTARTRRLQRRRGVAGRRLHLCGQHVPGRNCLVQAVAQRETASCLYKRLARDLGGLQQVSIMAGAVKTIPGCSQTRHRHA